MADTEAVTLEDLNESNLVLANADDDVRGLPVVDLQGHRLGTVVDLVVDEQECRARLLVVSSGGILGLDRRCHLLPVDAVTRVGDEVHVETPCEQVHRAEQYDPRQLSPSPYDQVYLHFGYVPFWGSAYIRPHFLRRAESGAS